MQENVYALACSRSRSLALQPLQQEAVVREAARLTTRRTGLDLLKALDGHETADEIVTTMVSNAENIKDADLDGYVQRFERALTVATLRARLATACRSRTIPSQVGQGAKFEIVVPVATEMLAELASLASRLPAGTEAMKAMSNIDGGSTEELGRARDLLRRLGTVIGWMPREQCAPGVPADILPLLDVPEVGHSEVRATDQQELNPNPIRDSIRHVCAQAHADTDLALISVLRGDHQGLTLRPASSRAEVHDRAKRVRAAHQVLTVSGRDKR